MDRKKNVCADSWEHSSYGKDLTNEICSDPLPFSNFSSHQHQQKWEDPSILDYGIRIEPPSFQKFGQPSDAQTSVPCNYSNVKTIADCEDVRMNETLDASKVQDWDPSTMLNNLSFLEQKIQQLQKLVHLIVGHKGQVLGQPDEMVVAQQQQLITADLTSIIAQLVSTAGSLLPSVNHTLPTATPSMAQFGQLGGSFISSGAGTDACAKLQIKSGNKLADRPNQSDLISNYKTEQNFNIGEHESKDEEDAEEGENLQPGTYEILQLEKEEILAPHTHFCAICGKGFKRDANLRMHMRGHGDEYKTAAALAKPNKESSEPTPFKRYSCPYAGCKRNKEHKKFQPLKTILCVKNHYKRTHCDKSYICSRCNTKKFSVIADLKTHEKHCGKDKWLCSCGSTFSRKDKLFGHIALFQGHTPAIALEEMKGTGGPSDHGEASEAPNIVGSIDFNLGSTTQSSGGLLQNNMEVKGVEDPTIYFSPLNFDACNFDGFPRPPFDDSESSFSFLMPGSSNYIPKAGGDSTSHKPERP